MNNCRLAVHRAAGRPPGRGPGPGPGPGPPLPLMGPLLRPGLPRPHPPLRLLLLRQTGVCLPQHSIVSTLRDIQGYTYSTKSGIFFLFSNAISYFFMFALIFRLGVILYSDPVSQRTNL